MTVQGKKRKRPSAKFKTSLGVHAYEGLSMQEKKCVFVPQDVEHLEHTLNKQKIMMRAKINDVKNLPLIMNLPT